MQFVTLKPKSIKKIPYVTSMITAGFPSPAEDYIDKRIDLNEQLINNPAATFMVRVDGFSMTGCGINEDDVLIVDKSLKAKDKDIILAIVNGEFTVKRLNITTKGIILSPENDKFKDILINESSEFQVWGVVTYIIHKAK